MSSFPEKFVNLHHGEEFVREKSIEAASQSDDLALHMDVCEKSADSIYYFIHRDNHADDDDLAVRLLGIRIFNCINATLKLALSGYYQASAWFRQFSRQTAIPGVARPGMMPACEWSAAVELHRM
jgi:hypothetical protein